ncbi:hypothetical protein ETB97_004179 [Aspergillus alliaceus]|uniref:Uncharacterized protein n=1 Tax=Petromyces alliaceus TaxID=209559 RepID=A0A8H6EB48_PETAA|nr:hypothetical protein ETB97_004179 [Aspergillus burnettii]
MAISSSSSSSSLPAHVAWIRTRSLLGNCSRCPGVTHGQGPTAIHSRLNSFSTRLIALGHDAQQLRRQMGLGMRTPVHELPVLHEGGAEGELVTEERGLLDLGLRVGLEGCFGLLGDVDGGDPVVVG